MTKFDKFAVLTTLIVILLAGGAIGASAQVAGELPQPMCLSCDEFGITWMWSPPPFSVPIPIIYCARQSQYPCPND